MGLVEEDLDGFGRVRLLAFISRWQTIARRRESQMLIKTKVPAPHGPGRVGNEGDAPSEQNGAFGGTLGFAFFRANPVVRVSD